MKQENNMSFAAARIALVICPPFWTKLPPLGLAYLSGVLAEREVAHDVYDMNVAVYACAPEPLRKKWLSANDYSFCRSLFEDASVFADSVMAGQLKQLSMRRYKVIGFSVFKSNRAFSERCARVIKQKNPDVCIVFGGPEVKNYLYESCDNEQAVLPEGVDCFVDGEGESVFYDLCMQALHAQKDLPSGVYSATEKRRLDDLPFPAFDSFDLSMYDRKRALPIVLSRGCVRQCRFCAERLLFSGYRARSAENIVAEIEHHMRVYKTVWFTFHDSLINGDMQVLEDMCALIVERQLMVKWEAQAAIRQDMDVSLLRLMKSAGCFNLFVGLESGSDTVLALMNKGYTSDDAAYFFLRCHEAGMHFEVSMIFGFPGEDEQAFEETQKFFRAYRERIPKVAQVNPFIVLPGTAVSSHDDLPDVPGVSAEYACERVERFVHFLRDYDFVITSSFVNNLVS